MEAQGGDAGAPLRRRETPAADGEPAQKHRPLPKSRMSPLENPTTKLVRKAGAGDLPPLASVLVIDDEKIVVNTLGALLQADGFEVACARSAEQGVELLRRRRFEVAIADLAMPEMDGIQTIAALREVDPNIEVIILTGHVTVDSTIAALRQGACDFLQKPVGVAQLRPALMRALEKRRNEVAQSEARARTVIETAREAIVLFDREGIVRDFNPVAEQIFGLTREQALGRNLADFAIPARLVDVFRKHLETAYREGKDPTNGSVEVVAIRQNGEEFPFEISTTVIDTPEGKYLSTFGRDVSERKQAEQATRESEAKLKVIFDGVEAGIFLIDPQTHEIVDVNPPALDLVGADRDTVVGAVCHKFVCPAECGRCPVTDLNQTVDNSERLLLTAAGKRLPIIKTVRPVVISGRPLLLESFVDISARKQAELALAEAEAHFRSLFASIPLPTFSYDAETLQYLEVNEAAVSYSGYSRGELLQMHVTDLAAPGFAQHIESRIKAIRSDSGWHDHGRHQLRDGRLVDVEVDAHVLEFRGRKAILAVVQDVTERNRAQTEMAERHRMATLVADVGMVLTRAESLRQGLQQCAEVLAQNTGAAFARVWTVNEGENVLELQASAGMYTHVDGGHARVAIGKFKIGRIAETGEPYLTNSLQEDSWVGDLEWARREGMVAFAGYPLKVQGRVLGVVAAFARQPLTEATLQAFASVADNTAQFIKRKRAEDALRESEDRYRDLVENSFVLIGTHDVRGRILSLNQAAANILEGANAGQTFGRLLTEYVPSELLPQFEKYLTTILQEGSAEGLMVIATPGGKRKIIEYRNTLRRQEGKEPIVRWSGQDVTERIQAEEALRISEIGTATFSNAIWLVFCALRRTVKSRTATNRWLVCWATIPRRN